MVGRPQFDDPTVIDAAMDVFWRHGYVASSINQLTAATGLSRSSLYQRFHDKNGLFQEALLTYSDWVLQRMRGVRAKTKREQMKALLHEFVENHTRSEQPTGCLLVRSCTELLDIPGAGQSVVRAAIDRQRALIVDVLEEAVARDEFPPTADLAGLSWHFLGVLQTITNLPQAGATAGNLRSVIDIAMLAWPDAKKSPVSTATTRTCD